MTASALAWRRHGARLVLAGTAALAVAGCVSIPARPGPVMQATGPAPPPAPPPVILTGSRLRSLLLPASFMPARLRPDRAGARDSGTAVVSDTSTPPPPGRVCALLTRASWLLAAGISGAAFAENRYTNAAHTAQIGQEIDAFQAADASQVMHRLWLAFHHCASFTGRYARRAVTVSGRRERLAGLGDAAIMMVLTSPAYRGGETLVAVRAGNNVITCFDSSPGKDLGAPAVALARDLTSRVRPAIRAQRPAGEDAGKAAIPPQ